MVDLSAYTYLRAYCEAQQAKLERAQEELAKIMIAHSFATGHGDTIMDLLKELKMQLRDQMESGGHDTLLWW
jgi:fido (protein-threonine AMPylation protein)